MCSWTVILLLMFAGQIATIRSYTLARAMCDAIPEIETIQPLLMLLPGINTGRSVPHVH